jgi:Transglycosylase SLT domain
MISELLVHDVPIECINKAAITYRVPAALIISVLGVENGRVGMASPNKNGSFDYGPMQINSLWVEKIKPYGYTREELQYDPCVNVMVGAWILGQNIADSPDFWRGVGGYHSYTPPLNEKYRYQVEKWYKLLNQYLSQNKH